MGTGEVYPRARLMIVLLLPLAGLVPIVRESPGLYRPWHPERTAFDRLLELGRRPRQDDSEDLEPPPSAATGNRTVVR